MSLRRSAALAVALLTFFGVGWAAGQSVSDPYAEVVAAQADLAEAFALWQELRGELESLAAHLATAEALLAPTTTVPSTTTTLAPTTTTLPPTTTSTSVPPMVTCVGVQVAVGANLSTVAGQHGAGTTFCLPAGTFPLTAAIPFQNGDRWIGAAGSGGERLSILTGNGVTKYFADGSSDGVLLANVVIERFANDLQQGTNRGAQTNWTFQSIEVRNNSGAGLHLHDDSTLRNSFIHHNNQLGLGGSGDRVLIEGNEISFNNFAGAVMPGFEAGGSKWTRAVGSVIADNWFHDNCGPGIWFDGPDNFEMTIVGNVSENNWGKGIVLEMSGGGALVADNVVSGNAFGKDGPICEGTPAGESGGGGSGGIDIDDTPNVEVARNVVEGNDGGITAADEDRGVRDPDLTNLYVHDNTVSWGSGFVGVQDLDPGSNPFSAAANNRFENNTYVYTGSSSTPFQWQGGKSWAGWQAAGQDLEGSFS